VIGNFLSRVTLNLNRQFGLLLAWNFLPQRYRSGRTNLILSLADKQLSRIDRACDVQAIVERNDDIQLLLEMIFDKEKLLLFKKHKRRLVSQSTENGKTDDYDISAAVKLLGKVKIDHTSRVLVKGVLSTGNSSSNEEQVKQKSSTNGLDQTNLHMGTRNEVSQTHFRTSQFERNKLIFTG
jgi:hypothetical protein